MKIMIKESFLMLMSPPKITLFPYTTLFRSLAPASPADGAAPCRRGRSPGRGPRPQDRKSTRLNSSHVAISYAVFCLKKKIKINKVEIYKKYVVLFRHVRESAVFRYYTRESV